MVLLDLSGSDFRFFFVLMSGCCGTSGELE